MKTIENFQSIWDGGFYEGNPLDPMGPSEYGALGYISVINAIYLMCIRPYVDDLTTVLEIGPGRGAWTKCFVERGAAKISVVDAAPAEHSGFWNYVGRNDRIEYFVAEDFSLSMIEDGSISFFFSFGAFCHIHPTNIEEYIKSLSVKLRPGAHGFLMVADYDKYNNAVLNQRRYTFGKMFQGRRFLPMRLVWNAVYGIVNPLRFGPKDPDEAADMDTAGLRWFNAGTEKVASFLRHSGFEVLDQDIGISHRDPILHFRKM